MQVEVRRIIDWNIVLDAARVTINKNPESIVPSEKFIKQIILAEHSPLRCVQYTIYWKSIESWIATHFLRHHIGTLPFVGTQREDRTGIPHSERKRNELIPFLFIVNAQSIINISRKRLCRCAALETSLAWKEVLEKLKDIDPLLADKCVPECVYRGFCPELKCCEFVKTKRYNFIRGQYIQGGILPIKGE